MSERSSRHRGLILPFMDKRPKIDPSALKKSKTTKGKDGVTVAAGALQVGDTPFKDVAFTWRGGDWG